MAAEPSATNRLPALSTDRPHAKILAMVLMVPSTETLRMLPLAWSDRNKLPPLSTVAAHALIPALVAGPPSAAAPESVPPPATVVMIPAALLVRRPPALETANAAARPGDEDPGMTVAQALKSPQFIILLLVRYAGMTYANVGRLMGMEEHNVRFRLEQIARVVAQMGGGEE